MVFSLEAPSAEISLNTTVASHVAFKVHPIITDDVKTDERFPFGTLTVDQCMSLFVFSKYNSIIIFTKKVYKTL